MEAVSHAGTVLGVLATDGVVLAAEKEVTGKQIDLSEAKEGRCGALSPPTPSLTAHRAIGGMFFCLVPTG
jgi:hypothetical protein